MSEIKLDSSRTEDPGTGTQYTINSKRLINRDGSFNVIKSGLGYSTRNIYQSLIKMSWTRFFLIIFSFLFGVNVLFAALYTLIGIDQLGGITSVQSFNNLLEAFYFSLQTFTTVGYGVLHPVGHLANIVAGAEAILGWMCFALITGILYGRFSKPSARLMYSDKVLISPYKNGYKSLQFRIANMRNSNLLEMEATVLLVLVEKNENNTGVARRSFIDLKLERSSVMFFPLNWTIVHIINEDSPFYGKTQEDFNSMDTEIVTIIKGYDDTFSQTVHSRYSYKCEDIVWGGKFKSTYKTVKSGDIILHFDKMSDYDRVEF
ncbi:ion channel [Fulvivirga sediminis]|uniref:Potassium transporter n=1 Tax=Fulvivirga sediminis TaxID=2803949 RepID=A0A937F7H8_9BACT|nr:ion channel [Fulvivirga sediminis]MBL3656039.1 potassium transporter [Fulvivirga sediminis]